MCHQRTPVVSPFTARAWPPPPGAARVSARVCPFASRVWPPHRDRPKPRKTGFRPKRSRSTRRRMLSRTRCQPGVGGVQGVGPKTAKMPVFAVCRRGPSISKAQQKQAVWAKVGPPDRGPSVGVPRPTAPVEAWWVSAIEFWERAS